MIWIRIIVIFRRFPRSVEKRKDRSGFTASSEVFGLEDETGGSDNLPFPFFPEFFPGCLFKFNRGIIQFG